MTLFIGLGLVFCASAQDNSPYSRYGLGNTSPNTSAANRGMGGVAAGYIDIYNINYANPASYSFFQTFPEPNSKKISSGRVLLNIGVDATGRTLIPTHSDTAARFTANNIVFSQVMVGVPLRKNWGMAFGIRPVTSIAYNIASNSLLKDNRTGLPIDSARTINDGAGGAHLASLGTGAKFKIAENQYLSFGVNAGYMFGKKEYNSRISLVNDSLSYEAGHIQSKTTFGGIYFDAGMQYFFKAGNDLYATIGAYGNWNQKLNAKASKIAETYSYSSSTGYTPIDTISIAQKDVKGTIQYPQTTTVGFVLQRSPASNKTGWQIGADFTHNAWNGYRYYGAADTAVKSNWQAKIGAEIRPAAKRNYASNVVYRFGFYTGPDYIYLGKTLPGYGVTAGLGLPLRHFDMQARNQSSIINIGFEYIKRGNNSSPIKENMYRLSLGFSLSDVWFIKRKYE